MFQLSKKLAHATVASEGDGDAEASEQDEAVSVEAASASKEASMEEALARHPRERQSEKDVEQCNDELAKLRLRYQGMESDIEMNKLRCQSLATSSKLLCT